MSDTDKKAAKKAAKKVAREREAPELVAQPGEVEEGETPEEKAARKAAKKAKKAAKKAKEAAEACARDEEPSSKRRKTGVSTAMAVGSARVDYLVHPDTAAMSTEEAAAYRKGLEVAVYPPEVGDEFLPLTAFDQLAPSLGTYCGDVTSYIQQKSFKTPSPIQVLNDILMSIHF